MLPFWACGVLSAGLAVTMVTGLLGGTVTAFAGMAVRATVRLVTAAGTRTLVSGRGRSRRFRDTSPPNRISGIDAAWCGAGRFAIDRTDYRRGPSVTVLLCGGESRNGATPGAARTDHAADASRSARVRSSTS